MRARGEVMAEIALIGIGTGNPDHLTRAAEAAINDAEVILLPRKGPDKADLADLRRLILSCVLTNPAARVVEFDLPRRETRSDYLGAVRDWHDAVAAAWTRAMGNAARVALLVWGDPSLYDSSLRIAGRLSPAARVRVVPGITAIQALTAAHAIPLNPLGGPVTITTARQVRDHGLPVGSTVVMLDDGSALAGIEGDLDIWWGAYLGMPGEILMQGPLDRMRAPILAARAQARARHGWIMDVYLLRPRVRTGPDRGGAHNHS